MVQIYPASLVLTVFVATGAWGQTSATVDTRPQAERPARTEASTIVEETAARIDSSSTERIPKAEVRTAEVTNSPSVDLLPFLKMTEVTTRGKRIPLFDGRENGGLEGGQRIATEYPVDRSSKLVIEFDPTVNEKVKGDLFVRARLLRDPPVELQVDNFTIVDRNTLRQETPASIPRTLLRRAEELGALDENLKAIEKAIRAVRVAEAQVEASHDRAKGSFTANSLPPGFVLSEIDSYRAALDRMSEEHRELIRRVDEFGEAVTQKLLSDSLTSAVSDKVFDQIRQKAQGMRRAISNWAVAVQSTSSSAGALKACAAPTAQNWPDVRGCLMLNVPQALANARQQRKSVEEPLPDVLQPLGIKLEKASDGRGGSDILIDEVLLHIRSELDHIAVMLRSDLERVYGERLRPPGQLHLSSIADLEHGETIEIVVSNRVPELIRRGTNVIEGESTPRDFIWRFHLRVVKTGISYRVSPQFVLVKRLSDISVPTNSELPANFTPAPGVVLTGRIRTRAEWADWVIPSFGLLATAVHFDSKRSVELGLGVSMGLANELIHVGVGVNVMTAQAVGIGRASYGFISLDFAQSFNVLGNLLGTPNKETAQ